MTYVEGRRLPVVTGKPVLAVLRFVSYLSMWPGLSEVVPFAGITGGLLQSASPHYIHSNIIEFELDAYNL